MKKNMNFRTIFFFFVALMIPASVFSATLQTDTFDTGMNGWSGTSKVLWDSGNQRLFIDRDDTANKQFTFVGYENQTVQLTLDYATTLNWENRDKLEINGTPFDTPDVSNGSITTYLTLDASGQVTVTLKPNTNRNNEDIYIDNITFSTIPLNTVFESPDASDRCNGDVFAPLDGVINDTTATLLGASQNGDNDYYQFTVGGKGQLTITTSSPNSQDYRMRVGSTCRGQEYYVQQTLQSHPVAPITLFAGDTVYIYLRESGRNTDEYKLNFNFTALPNNPPVISPNTFTVSEGATVGTTVGTVTASDPDSDPLTYTIIAGNTDNIFAIDNNGVITVADRTLLDYETTTQYVLNVTVFDGIETVATNITIDITDVLVEPIIYYEGTNPNGDCGNVETILPMDGITDSAKATLIGSSPNNDIDLYKFTVAVGGTLNIQSSSPDGSTRFFLKVGSFCNGEDYFPSTFDLPHNVNPIKLSAGDTVYLYLKEYGWDTDDYQLDFDFTRDLLPGEMTTGYAGPEGTIGSDGIIDGVNNNNSDLTFLVDDDKVECPSAPYDNINDALTAVEAVGTGTIVLCKGTYNAPRKIKNLTNFGLTSNYDTPVGTTIVGQVNFESLDGLTISHITFDAPNTKAISLDFTNNVNISNINVKASMESISAQHINTEFEISDSKFFSQNTVAVEVNGASNIGSSIKNVTIGNAEDDKTGNVGISVGIDKMVIDQTTVYSHADGIQLRNSPNSQIRNSNIYSNTVQSIWIDNSANAIIDNTKFLSNTGKGLNITNSSNVKVTNSMLEALQLEALSLDASEGGYYQNNCFATSSRVYDVAISENMTTGTFDDGAKGNFYAKAECTDDNGDNICDFPFHIVVNHSAVYTDNFPQRLCNIGIIDNQNGPMFLETMIDINPADNRVETTSVIGTNTGVTAYTKNSLSSGNGGVKEKVNLLIIADVSGSMYNSRYGGVVTLADGSTTTKLAVTEDAIKLLIEKYSLIADVNYDLIQFSSNIDANSGWTNIKTTPVPSLLKGGSTDYYDALTEAMDVALANQPASDKTLVYFLSDGEATQSVTDFNDPTFLDYWFNSVVMNPDVFRTYTYGILFGGPDLGTVAIPDEGYKTPAPIIMNTPEDIIKELLKTLDYTIEYELVDDYGGGFYIDRYTGEIFVRDSSVFDIINDPLPTVTVRGIDTINNLEIFGDFSIELVEGIDTGISNAYCDMFADALQTRIENCTVTDGIVWSGEAVISNNPDSMLNTCNVDIPKWVSDKVNTCTTAQCQKSDIIGKNTTIKYAYLPENAFALSKPTNSTINENINVNSTTTNADINQLIINQAMYTMNTSKVTNINFHKFTRNATLNITPVSMVDLQIGNISVYWDGSYNNLYANNNLNNIKIKNINLPAIGNDISLKANNSINIEGFTVGTGGIITLEAPVVTLGTLNIPDKGGNTIINIKADVINIGTMDLGQNIQLTTEPLNNNKLLFRSNIINFSSSSMMKVGNGFYYINDTLNIPGMSDGRSIQAIDDVQEIDIFINNDLTLGNNPAINADSNNGGYGSLPPENFRMFINGNFATGGGGTTINGLIYTEGDVILGAPSYVRGAISALNKIELFDGAQVEYASGIFSSAYGACPAIAQPKPTVSFFEAWDATKPIDDRIIDTKIAGQSFELNIASLSGTGTGTENVEFNFWLQDIPTGEILTVPALTFSQSVDAISKQTFQINGAYKNIHAIFQICSDYDSTTNQYELYALADCNSACVTQLQETAGNPCMREVQGVEGFSSRPLKYSLEFQKVNDNSITLTNFTDKVAGVTHRAGENFKVIATAEDINGNPVSNFNEDFQLEVVKLDADMVSDGTIDADVTTLPTGQLTFESGKLEFEASYSEVGFAKFKISDNPDFAQVDAQVGIDSHIIKGEDYMAGRFTPFEFSITEVNLKNLIGNNAMSRVNNCNYNYLNETGKNESIYQYGISLEAVNKNGDVTRNYTESFAKNTNVAFNVNWRNVGPTNNVNGSTPVAITVPALMWNEGTYSTPVGSEISATVDILQSIGVDRTQPFEPFAVNLTSEVQLYTDGFSVSDTDISAFTDNGLRLFDITALLPDIIYYVYGRINPIDAISAENGNANIPVYYEIYADTQQATLVNILGGGALLESVNDAKWWRNHMHSTCDVRQTGDLTITFNTPNTSIVGHDYSQTDRDIITVQDTTANRPLDSTATIDLSVTDSFLLHIPYSNQKESRFNIRFIGNNVTTGTPADSASNSGKTTANQSRFIR